MRHVRLLDDWCHDDVIEWTWRLRQNDAYGLNLNDWVVLFLKDSLR